MVIEIPLSKRGKLRGKYVTIVDDCDGDLAEINWGARTRKYTTYASRYDKPTNIHLHRLILERMLGRPLVKGECVDHINMNGLDNRRENLRLATHSQNMANKRNQSNNTSGYRGVFWRKEINKWGSRIRYNGKTYHIGVFDDIEVARKAYKAKALELFGEFARFEDRD